MPQQSVIAKLDPAILQFTSAKGDRFIYSPYFVPCQIPLGVPPAENTTPVLSSYQKIILASYRDYVGAERFAAEAKAAGFGGLADPDVLPLEIKAPPWMGGGAPGWMGGGGSSGPPFWVVITSGFGLLFLDRTRIRPSGFVLGDHILSLSLAPGEEVVLEQHTFSKREVTFEEQNQVEQQYDIEFSSTLSTAVDDGIDLQQNRTNKTDFSVKGDIHGSMSDGEGDNIGGSISPSYSTSTNDAHNLSSKTSVKDSNAATSKVASKYRSVHQTTMKISTEQRFETAAHRTVRNPNRYTPIDLHYFKIMQQLEFHRERYGVRLCWAPSIPDPASAFFERLQAGYNAILQSAEPELPPKPQPPQPDPNIGPEVETTNPLVAASRWGFPQMDQRADYMVTVKVPANYTWDGDAAFVETSLAQVSVVTQSVTNAGYRLVFNNTPGLGTDEAGNQVVQASIHVGVNSTWDFNSRIQLGMSARFVPTPAADPNYAAAYTAWQNAMVAWQNQVYQAQQAARAGAIAQAQQWEDAVMSNLDIVSELLGRAIDLYIPQAARKDCTQIETWKTLFEWDRASYALMPDWWSSAPPRDPTRGSTDFINASCAQLFVPIKPGLETEALRMVLFGQITPVPYRGAEIAISDTVADLTTYRTQNFGDPQETPITAGAADDHQCPSYDEKYQCLAKWSDTIPTDGTHLEVVQGMSMAADSLSASQLSDAAQQRGAQLAFTQESTAFQQQLGNALPRAALSVHVTENGPANLPQPPS